MRCSVEALVEVFTWEVAGVLPQMESSKSALKTYIHLMPCWPAEMPIVWLKTPTLRGFGADARKWPNKVTLRPHHYSSGNLLKARDTRIFLYYSCGVCTMVVNQSSYLFFVITLITILAMSHWIWKIFTVLKESQAAEMIMINSDLDRKLFCPIV